MSGYIRVDDSVREKIELITTRLENNGLRMTELVDLCKRGTARKWIHDFVIEGYFTKSLIDGGNVIICFSKSYMERSVKAERIILVKALIVFEDISTSKLDREKYGLKSKEEHLVVNYNVGEEFREKLAEGLFNDDYYVTSNNRDSKHLVKRLEGEEENNINYIIFPWGTELYGELSAKIIFYGKIYSIIEYLDQKINEHVKKRVARYEVNSNKLKLQIINNIEKLIDDEEHKRIFMESMKENLL